MDFFKILFLNIFCSCSIISIIIGVVCLGWIVFTKLENVFNIQIIFLIVGLMFIFSGALQFNTNYNLLKKEVA